MNLLSTLSCLPLLIWLSSAGTSATNPLLSTSAKACGLIAQTISTNSAIFLPGSSEYASDVAHFALSAEQNSTCSVEVGTAADLRAIVKILGSTRAPFAVKGGGHNLNPGFSSTSGVQLSMIRFNNIVYHAKSQTVDIGSGLIWDDVYAALDAYNVSVVGGRATGVGVAGLLLGGGYSYKTNQYGLAVDSLTALEVVLPFGEVRTVTERSDPDLFFALRGGGNNFGIVTQFTMRTHAQGTVWGGSITYDGTRGDAVTNALLTYTTNNSDPRTGLQCTYATVSGESIVMVNLFYNGPTPPPGIFDSFLTIPSISTDIGSRSYLSLIQSANTNLTAGVRGLYNTISHTAVTRNLTSAMRNQTNFYSSLLSSSSLLLAGYVVEPFIPSAYLQGKSATAYPPNRLENIHPMNIYYAWTDPAFDDEMLRTSRTSATLLKSVATAEGILGSVLYPNYALVGTSVNDLYGKHTERLRDIKRRFDPLNVMGLTGGFKL